jgi:hypothetical protein
MVRFAVFEKSVRAPTTNRLNRVSYHIQSIREDPPECGLYDGKCASPKSLHCDISLEHNVFWML